MVGVREKFISTLQFKLFICLSMWPHTTPAPSRSKHTYTYTYTYALRSRHYPLFGVFQRYASSFKGRKFHFGHTPTKQDTCSSLSSCTQVARCDNDRKCYKNFVLANVDMQCVTLQALHACITNTHTYNYIATLSLHCYFYSLLALCYADLSVVVTICVLCCSCYSTLHI